VTNNKTIAVLSITALIVSTLAAYTWFHNQSVMQNVNIKFNTHDYAKGLISPREGQPVKKFTLVAQDSWLSIKDGLTLPVWTYNGTVPGQEIRVTQGDFVQVELRNNLGVPVTIHWHGYPVISAMDGVPGINQDAVKPGETFIYQFSADAAGTYWYHSHQQGALQVDKGLYGSLIVEPKYTAKPNKDFTLILDEWQEQPSMDMQDMSGNEMSAMDGMKKSQGDNREQNEDQAMAEMYNVYTVNGKSGRLIKPLEVAIGDVVRLRFINAGYRTHGIHLPGQSFRVISSDGQEINEPGIVKDQIVMVAPGERYDLQFTVRSNESFVIDAHDENKFNDQLKIPVNVLGSNQNRLEPTTVTWPVFDLTNYGTPAEGLFTLDQKFDVDYQVNLNSRLRGKIQEYTINGETFKELPSLKLKTGNNVKFTIENKSTVDHPMHLHGHFFQVLSKNDVPLTGSVIMKDTLLIKPGERYVVAFKADNSGRWVQHCHELHHAAAGMMQKIEYIDYKPNYIPDLRNQFNQPE